MNINYFSKLIYGFKISYKDAKDLSKEIKEKYILYTDLYFPDEDSEIFFGISIDKDSIGSIPIRTPIFSLEEKSDVVKNFYKYFPDKKYLYPAVYLCLGVC